MKDYLKEDFHYKHFFADAPHDPSFPDHYQFILVDNEDSFGEMCARALELAKQKKLVLAVDSETTDLNHETCDVVGFSLCFEEDRAYYIPLGHRIGTNLPEKFWPWLVKLFYRAVVVPMFNARFDLRIAEKIGADRHKINFYDIAVPVWHTDTNWKFPGLKWAAKKFLGWDMTTYEEALSGNQDLSFTEPSEAAKYAGADALSTWHLARRMEFMRKRHPFIMDLDNRVLLPVMLMEETPTPIQIDKVTDARTDCVQRMEEIEPQIHAKLGQRFLLTSPQQLGEVLSKNGIDTGKRTKKTKKMQTGIKELEPIKNQHPAIPLLIEYKKLNKFLTSYCNSFLKEYDKEIGGIRFAYQTTVTPTGRLAAGGDEKNSFFASKLNVQAVDKPSTTMYGAIPCDDPTEENCFLGWKFIPEPLLPDDYDRKNRLVEGFSPKLNIRAAFRPYPGHLWVHFDYMAQELRIPSNLSKEPVWVEAFKNQEDLHRKVAAMIWGEENAAAKRKFAKALNFGALYGGSKYTFSEQLGVPPDEAQQILDDWWAALKVLKRWARTSENRGKKEGTIETFFGRPRRVRHYFSQSKWSMQGFARRTCVNTQVQGAGADIIKIAMLRIYDNLLAHPQNGGRIKQINCVHDELNFSVLADEPFFTDACLGIQEQMQFEIPGWEIPMLVDCAIGDSWGNMFPMHCDPVTRKWTPRWD